MKEFGLLIMKSSYFFSEEMIKHVDPFIFGATTTIILLILAVGQTLAFFKLNEYKRFHVYIIPSITLCLIADLLINLIFMFVFIQLHIVTLMVLTFVFCIIKIMFFLIEENESLFRIGRSINDYFNNINNKQVTLKKYKQNYHNSILKSEDIWKQL